MQPASNFNTENRSVLASADNACVLHVVDIFLTIFEKLIEFLWKHHSHNCRRSFGGQGKNSPGVSPPHKRDNGALVSTLAQILVSVLFCPFVLREIMIQVLAEVMREEYESRNSN